MPIEYSGPERRRRRVYVTHNTEYHLHDEICVAVRDRHTGEFDQSHIAIGRKLEGAMAYGEGIAGFHRQPKIGDAMLFQAGKREVITSPIERVTRPPREVIHSYPAF
jgi:hypothetical protein